MLNKLLHRISTLFSRQERDNPQATPLVVSPIDAYNQTRHVSLQKSFCYAPSINMLFSQDGTVKACCHNQYYSLGKYPNQSIREIWGSKEANELRAYMEKSDLRHGCGICEADLNRKAFDEIPSSHFDALPRTNSYPSMMEFLLTNTCNLECVMCQGEFSSSIRKNRDKLPAIISPYDQAFIEQLKEFIPHLSEARFSGSGEAFSIDMNFEIWELIIAMNPACLIMVQSNGTYLNSRIKNIVERGHFQIGISLDSLNKKTFEAIRLNANFERVMENILYFSEYSRRKNIQFNIATCVMRQNWNELPDFINFCNRIGAIATFHKVWSPENFSLHNLPSSDLQNIYEQLSKAEFSVNSKIEQRNKSHYCYFVSVIKQWLEAQQQVEKEAEYINGLTANELFHYLENKTESFLTTDLADENTRHQALKKFKLKFTALLEMYPDNTIRELVTRRACAVPSQTLLSSFEKHSTEFLFAETQKRVINTTP